MYKFVLSVLLIFISITSVWASTVSNNVREVQSPASYTAPSGFEEKWFVGSIIAQIFSPVWQILSQYILAFQNIISSDNNIPVWNASTGVFDVGTLYDVSWNIGVWISLPQTQLHVSGIWRFDGGIEIDGNQTVTPSWNGIAAHSPDANRYWFFKVWNGNGEEWAYFWYGNGEDRVNLALRWDADKLIISWWNVGISTVSPTHSLDVNGKIRMRNQTVNSDNDDIVATKWYVDDNIVVDSQASENGYVWIWDILIQWWKLQNAPLNQSFTNIDYPIPFPNSTFNIQATISRENVISWTVALVVKEDSITNTSFAVAGDQDTNHSLWNIYWYAVWN